MLWALRRPVWRKSQVKLVIRYRDRDPAGESDSEPRRHGPGARPCRPDSMISLRPPPLRGGGAAPRLRRAAAACGHQAGSACGRRRCAAVTRARPRGCARLRRLAAITEAGCAAAAVTRARPCGCSGLRRLAAIRLEPSGVGRRRVHWHHQVGSLRPQRRPRAGAAGGPGRPGRGRASRTLSGWPGSGLRLVTRDAIATVGLPVTRSLTEPDS